MPVSDAPTLERGSSAGNLANALAPVGANARGWLPESYEDVPELTFPTSAIIYDRVRKDSQVAAILRAARLPLLRAGRHHLNAAGARPEVVRWVAANLGLEDEGKRTRRRHGVNLLEVLRHGLLMLPFGFMPLEQVYDVAPAEDGYDLPEREAAYLDRLAPRMPRSIAEVRVDRNGDLLGLVQLAPGSPGDRTRGIPPGHVWIDRAQLVMFVHEREGAEWTGSSILREAYKHWLIKDALYRLGPMVVERNGMGLPVVTYGSAGNEVDALAIAKAARAGAEAGVALEEGAYSLQLLGVTGATRDELPLIKYHDEAVGRSALAMFLNLGHDNGARALGDTFVDYFVEATGAIDASLNATVTDFVIRDLVELNYGEDEPYPVLEADPIDAEATPTAEALSQLAAAGLLGDPDRGLIDDVRRRYRLPAQPPPTGDAAEVPAGKGSPVATVGVPALVDAGIITPDEGRALLGIPGTAPIPATIPDVYQPAGVDPDEGPPLQLPTAAAAPLRAALSSPAVARALTMPGSVGARLAARRALGLEPAGDDLVDRLERVTELLAATRAGHRA